MAINVGVGKRLHIKGTAIAQASGVMLCGSGCKSGNGQPLAEPI